MAHREKLVPTALRNKKTGHLLKLDVEAHEAWEYGVTEEQRVIKKYIELRDSDYSGVIFVTDDSFVIEGLLKEGKYDYPDIRIDFGWGRSIFEKTDLEAVTLCFDSSESVSTTT